MSASPSRPSALLAILLLVPAPSIGTIMAMSIIPGPIGQTIYGVCKVWLLALPLFWTLFVDGGKLGWSPPRQGGLTAGAVLGISLGGLMLGVYAVAVKHWIDAAQVRRMAEQFGISAPGKYVLFVLYLAFINSLQEEYVWRWFVFRKCEALLPGAAAVVLAGALFTIHHIVALLLLTGWRMTLLGSLGVCVGGVLWSWMYLRYRSIWPGYVCHVILDLVILGVGWWLIFGT